MDRQDERLERARAGVILGTTMEGPVAPVGRAHGDRIEIAAGG